MSHCEFLIPYFSIQIIFSLCVHSRRSCPYKSSTVDGASTQNSETQNPSIRPSELRARQKFALREKSFLGAVLDIAYDAWHSPVRFSVSVCVCTSLCENCWHPASAWDSQGCLSFVASRFEFTMNSILRQAARQAASQPAPPMPHSALPISVCPVALAMPGLSLPVLYSQQTPEHRPRLRNIWWVVQIQLVETFLFALFGFCFLWTLCLLCFWFVFSTHNWVCSPNFFFGSLETSNNI